MPTVEQYHGWEITLGQSRRGQAQRLAVRATNPNNPDDLIVVRTVENEDGLDYRTLLARCQMSICEKEVGRQVGQTREHWINRLYAAVEVNEQLRLERRAAKLTSGEHVGSIVARITGASLGTRGSKSSTSDKKNGKAV